VLLVGVSVLPTWLQERIVKLLVELGAVCSKYQEKLRSLSAKRVQCHEIWSFIGSREKSTTADKKGIVDLLN
jgi:hypothetical protein